MKTKYIFYFFLTFLISCSSNEIGENSAYKRANNNKTIGYFNSNSHIKIIQEDDSCSNRSFSPEYSFNNKLSELEMRYRIIEQLLCLDPNIEYKLDGATVSPFYSWDLFPYVEYLANTYGTTEEQLFMQNNYFSVVNPIYLIFNFPNDSGYVVYCTDSRVDNGLLVYSENGNLIDTELSFSPLAEHIGIDMANNIDTNDPLSVFNYIDSIHASIFHQTYPDERYNGFSSYGEYRNAMEVLTCCTNSYIPSDPSDCIDTTCETTNHSFRDRILPWHQSYPYNAYIYQGYLIGSVPLTLAKILVYSGYQGYVYDEYFDSYSYMYGQNMSDLYYHLANMSNILSQYQSPINNICDQSAAKNLLMSLGYTVETHDFVFIPDEIELIKLSLNIGRYVVLVSGHNWELIDAITTPRPCGVPFVYTDRSKTHFSLMASSIYNIVNSFNTNLYYSYDEQFKYLIIY